MIYLEWENFDDNNNPTKCPATSYGWCGDPMLREHPLLERTEELFGRCQLVFHGFQGANYSVIMRNDSTTGQYFKYMSIREVDPINHLNSNNAQRYA